MSDLRDLGYDFRGLARIVGVDVRDNHTADLIIKTKEGEYRRVYLTTGIVVDLERTRDPKTESEEAIRVVRLANGDKS